MGSDQVKILTQELMRLLEMQAALFDNEAIQSLTPEKLQEHKSRYLRIRELTSQLAELEKKR